jgi:3-oxoacyl-[acyl-carrier protein] reductase
MDLGLKGKVALVAGASKGLGFAVAHLLAAEGVKVSVGSRDRSRIEGAAARIREETKGEVFPCAVDVRSASSVVEWAEATRERWGGLDLLFSNAGGPPAGGFISFDDQAWQDAVELLLMSAVRMARAVIPSMKARGGGSILFSTSSSVKEPIENLTLSTVVRASIPALAKSLAREFAADNIRVNNLIPGRIDTDRVRELDKLNAERKNLSVEDYQRMISSTIPLGRYGKPEEYARAAVFLLSPAASYITGATLQVDGGIIKSIM